MFIVHSFVPLQCDKTAIVLIVKSYNSNISNSGGYEPIAHASIISSQFGFKQLYSIYLFNIHSYLNKLFALMSEITLLYLQSF